MEKLKVIDKKKAILHNLLPSIYEIFSSHYGMNVEIEIAQETAMEEIEEEDTNGQRVETETPRESD